jgi:ATP-dependent DNA ligase
MLARPGPLPAARSWEFEPKWDGFRVIIRAGGQY